MSTALRTVRPFQWLCLILRAGFLAMLGAALLFYVGVSLRWPMLVDSPVMHYVVFLMKHGLKPYSDITDNNMPGAYMMEALAMRVFGSADLGWRVYDFFLLAVLMGSMIVIALPFDWLAGVFAAGLFALRHGAEGPWFAGEREQEMTVLIAASCAFLFESVRRRRPVMALFYGLFCGVAASIKPTLSPFFLLSVCLLVVELRKRAVPWGEYVAWALGGALVAAAADVAFLVHFNALRAFFFVLHIVTPVYAGLSNPGLRTLLLHVAPFATVPLLAFALLPVWRWRRLDWERWVLLLAAACGLFSYFLQRKGFYHHRYLFLAFALLLAGLELIPLTRRPHRLGALGCIALLYAGLYVVPHEACALHRLPDSSPMTTAMEGDLAQLGTDRLQGQVQCFDLILGCLNSLYHLQLVENTGSTGDLLLFPTRPNPATDYYRAWFWRAQTRRPAGVLVMTNEDFGKPNSFNRLTLWPEFEAYLADHYTLAVTRTFPREGKLKTEASEPPETALAYRIYLRRGEVFPPLSQAVRAP